VDRTRLTRWLIPLPAILFALIPQNANAEPIPGIETVYYTIDEIPPIQSDTEYLVCGTEVENNINRNYDYELFEDCTDDLFMVHMTGFIDIPEHDTIEFMLATDDGGEMEIDGNTFGNWNDQGCSWMMSGELTLEAGSNAFNVWMYEHGGNSCIMLAWKIDNEGWAIVPDEVFTTNGIPTTTTSSSTTTTIALTTTTSSTTTVQETTTSWESSTTFTIPTTTSITTVVQTTVPVMTTTTSLPVPTGTTTTTEVIVSTTTTQPEVIEVELGGPQETISPTIETLPATNITVDETIVVVTETTEPETFITDPEEITVPDTTEPKTFVTLPETITVPDTTEPETFITDPDGLPGDIAEPDVTFPEVTLPDDTVPEEIVLDETDASTTTEPLGVYTQDTEEESPQLSSSTTLPDIPANEPVTDERIEEILNTFVEAEPEQIVAAITQVLAAEITSDQATEIASSPEVLAAITEDQAEELFEQIDVKELTEEQLEEFTAVIQEAPTKVKKAFEKTIDIFGSEFEDYVPTGSSIPVKTRRTLVAAGALIAAMPSTRIRR
jgi:hypothetical protein